MMRKGIVVALAVTGTLMVGPAARAATAEPSGLLPGTYTPQHSGHDHGKKADHDEKHGKKDGHGHGHGHHGHGHHHHHHHDGAHASGGYDSHREHPRGHDYHHSYSAPVMNSASADLLDHGKESAEDDHDHDGDGEPDHDPEDHDKDEKPKPKPKPGS